MGFTRDYFSFSQREKRGIITLLVIIFILIIFRNLDLFLDKNEIKNNKEIFKEIVAFEKSLKKTPKIEKKNFLFDFDPNTTTKEEFAKLGITEKQIKKILKKFILSKLGITEKQIKVIENYRNKGGRFFEKEDFKKIYSISDNLYKKLENYIKIEKINFSKKTPKIEKNFFLLLQK